MSHGLVMLPIMLAVALVSLTIPAICFGSPAPAAVPYGTEDCGHDTSPLGSVPTHGPAPLETGPVHQHGAPLACRHSGGDVQAPGIDKQVRLADASAVPAVTAPVIPMPAPSATVVDERPSKPPGLVLTVSQLRV